MNWNRDTNLSLADLRSYSQELVASALISQSQANQAVEEFNSPSTPDYPRCPICSHRLIKCDDCSDVSCNNGLCKGANLVRFLFSCQVCCSTPTVMDKCSEFKCLSRTIGPDRVGPTDSYIVCACGDIYVCDACATQKESLVNCGRCPRCQDCFCFGRCHYIGECGDCRRTTLCNDCMELEEEYDDGHLPDEGSSAADLKCPVLLTVCYRCEGSICADCFEECESRVCCGPVQVWCRHCRRYSYECVNCGGQELQGSEVSDSEVSVL